MPLGGIYKEEKVHTGGPSPWEVNRLSHNLGVPVLGSCREETSPLAYQEICRHRQKGWRRLDSTHDACMCAGLLTIRAERALPWQLLLPSCTSQSKGANTLAPLTPRHSLA